MDNTKTYIAYYRVSTKEQGKSGLGLEAQKETVKRFTNFCDDCVVAEYTDIASGKDNKRPQLLEAIAHAKKEGAKLLIAKLDRLSRNAAFIFTLRDSNVDFVCCDMPDATTVNIGIFATLAQHERELISKRTRDALAAKKAQGAKLGSPQNLTQDARQKGAEAMKAKAAANENTKKAAGYAAILRLRDDLSYKAIATILNKEGHKTARGKQYSATQVMRIVKKYER